MKQGRQISSIALVATLSLNSLAWPLTSQREETKSELATICDHHMQSLGLDLGTDPFARIQFQKAPETARREAEKPRKPTVTTYFQLPTKVSDIPLIFGSGKIVSAVDQKEIETVKLRLASLGLKDVHRNLTAANFEETIKKSPGDFIVLVGHNYEGKFAFLDGHGEDLADLAGSCTKAGKTCIFVSCRSTDWIPPAEAHGISYEITYDEGIYIATEISAFLARQANGTTSAKAVHTFLEGLEKRAHFKFKIKYIILKTCGGAAVFIILAIVIGNFDCVLDPNCPQRRHADEGQEKRPKRKPQPSLMPI